MTALTFLLRKPRLPIIINTETGLVGVQTWVAFRRALLAPNLHGLERFDVIDSTQQHESGWDAGLSGHIARQQDTRKNRR